MHYTTQQDRVARRKPGSSHSSAVGRARFVYPGQKRVAIYVEEGVAPAQRTGEYRTHRFPITDGRPYATELSLDREGFQLVAWPTTVEDFENDSEIRQIYYPEIEALIKRETGAASVIIFDHTKRTTNERDPRPDLRPAVQVAHNDYTIDSGPIRMCEVLVAAGFPGAVPPRVAIINVWRPLVETVQRMPLGLVDARSVSPADLVPAELIYPDRIGEIYELAYAEGHRWYFFSAMHRGEVVMFKSYDSASDGRARFTPHTGVDLLPEQPDAPSRESIEVRALALFSDHMR